MGGPLSGVRVLDFSSAVTGPFCTMLMGDLGHEFGLSQPEISLLLEAKAAIQEQRPGDNGMAQAASA